MVVAKESYAYINYRTLFLQELLHQRIGFCTKVIYYAPKSGSSLNCIVFSSVIDPYKSNEVPVSKNNFLISSERIESPFLSILEQVRVFCMSSISFKY